MRRSLFILPLIPGVLLMLLIFLLAILNPYIYNILTYEPITASTPRQNPPSPESPAASASGTAVFPYTIGSPSDVQPSDPHRPEVPEYMDTTPQFWLRLADKLEANKAIVHSPAALADLNGNGTKEAVVFALAFYPTNSAIPESREWLLVLDRGLPPYKNAYDFEITARQEVQISTSDPHIRISPVFPDGSIAIILATSSRAGRLTDNWLFRFFPEEKHLTALNFEGGSIGGRSSLAAISGRIEFFTREGDLMAEVAYGRGLALRSLYRWKGDHFGLEEEDLPAPEGWEAEIIRLAEEKSEHFMLALQLYGTAKEGRVVAYAEDGHYGYYYLFSYRDAAGPEREFRKLDSTRDEPRPFFRAHGIDLQAGRGFYYLIPAKRFVRSPEPVLP